jgi:hypothetical protein
VIDPSSLTKFHKLSLQDVNLLDMLIQKTGYIALEKELIKSKIIIVDATQAIRTARTNKKNVGQNQRQTYYFDIEKCKVCPFRKEVLYRRGEKYDLFYDN